MRHSVNTITTNNSQQLNNSKNTFMQGWECPRCNKINAPWKGHCDCRKEDKKSNWPGSINVDAQPPYVYYNEIFKLPISYGDQFSPLSKDPYKINWTDPCSSCKNSPKNGGSGLCNCILGDQNKVTC